MNSHISSKNIADKLINLLFSNDKKNILLGISVINNTFLSEGNDIDNYFLNKIKTSNQYILTRNIKYFKSTNLLFTQYFRMYLTNNSANLIQYNLDHCYENLSDFMNGNYEI